MEFLGTRRFWTGPGESSREEVLGVLREEGSEQMFRPLSEIALFIILYLKKQEIARYNLIVKDIVQRKLICYLHDLEMIYLLLHLHTHYSILEYSLA